MRKFGFSKQMIFLLLSLVIFSSGSIMVISYLMSNKLSNALVRENLESLNDSTYNLIDTSVNTSIKNNLRSIAEKNNQIVEYYYEKVLIGEMNENEAKEIVSGIFSTQTVGETGYIYVLNSSGILIEHPFLKGSDISEFDFVKKQIEMKTGYVEYLWTDPEDEYSREKVIYMAYFEPWDYIISVSSHVSEFTNLITLADFRENILSITIGETGYIYLMDSKGTLIIHPTQEGINIADLRDKAGNYYTKEILEGTEGVIIYPWINPGEVELKEKIVVYKYYEPMGWYVCSGVSLEEISEPVRVMHNKLILVSSIIFLISIVIVITYSKIILNPIKKLNYAMRKVVSGDYNVKIENSRVDEIGELTTIFNSMVEKTNDYLEELNASNIQLSELNENLENKVKLRTLDLELISNQDGLTGLFNRRRLDEYLLQSWEDSMIDNTPLSLLMIDIDFFKGYNDMYGHLEGDKCLIKVANRIKNTLREEIGFVARFGGEEFLVVLKNIDSNEAQATAERIRQSIISLKIPHTTSSIHKYVTVSIGLCTIHEYKSKSLNSFIEKMDNELYNAKESGRNTTNFSIY